MSVRTRLTTGRGYTLGGLYMGVALEYHVAGPFPAGSVLKSVRLAMSLNGASVIYIGAGLTASNAADGGNYVASASIIDGGETRLGGKMALSYVFTGAGYFWDEFPVGIVLPSGSWHLIFGIQNSGPGDLYMNLSCWPEYGLVHSVHETPVPGA